MVLLYGPPWDGAAQFSKHHLARYLAARGSRVLYVEAPLGPLTLARRRSAAYPELRSAFKAARLVGERLWVRRYFNPIPYHDVSPLTASRAANRLGQRLLAPVLRRDLARLGLRRPAVIVGLPQAVDVLPSVPRRGVVYHCADDYVHVKGFPASLAELEKQLCQQADLVVATAETLCASRARLNPHTYWIPNGVDVAHFARTVAPAGDIAGDVTDDVASGRRPVIGFVGGIAQWVDVPLIAHLARARPAWSFVLVGPVSTDVSSLAGLGNVRLLGPRPYRDVPRYLAAMDVALIPFVHDRVTYNADPIKAYEYLAAGVPVVATDVPALRRLAGVLRLASSYDAFVAALDAAVVAGREAGRAARQTEAAHHSWSARFARFEQLLQTCLPP